MRSSFILVLAFLAVLTMAAVCSGKKGELKMNFYAKSCPAAEDIAKEITQGKVAKNPSMVAKLVRLHYHDCFVRGCDASILLDPYGGEPVEKEARTNQGMTGYDVIDEIKTKLEKVCPETVSCADIVALAARDAVAYQEKVPKWKVPTGRRDGIISLASEALRDLPLASSNFGDLEKKFKPLSLDDTDLVALSGAHSIGVSHCIVIAKRLFNYTGHGDTDPSLNPEYANYLKQKCSNQPNPAAITLEMDPGSSLHLDNHYFVLLNQNKGLFQSDAALLTNQRTKRIVNSFLNSRSFINQFALSMKKMGAIHVLTGTDGEIRKNCRYVNA